jgi:hypothetical protein
MVETRGCIGGNSNLDEISDDKFANLEWLEWQSVDDERCLKKMNIFIWNSTHLHLEAYISSSDHYYRQYRTAYLSSHILKIAYLRT